MRRPTLACAALLAAIGIADHTEAASSFGVVYAFGDSLTDSGNAYLATLGSEPLSPPYWFGRFSNGPNWSQDLAKRLGAPVLLASLRGGTDFAIGGAQSGATSVHTLSVNDLPTQLAQFLTQNPSPPPGALYALWIGANDLLTILQMSGLTQAQKDQAVAQVVQNEAAFVTAIAGHGARNLLLVTAPDLGKIPATTSAGAQASAAATALTLRYNHELREKIGSVTTQLGIHLVVLDSFALIDAAVADPARFHFSDVNDPCWTGSYTSPLGTLCSPTRPGQNTYLFWDHMHPTEYAHALLAAEAAARLTAAGF